MTTVPPRPVETLHSVTPKGYVTPLNLVHLTIWPFTYDEYGTLPHVVFTLDVDWDPSCMDVTCDDTTWLQTQADKAELLHGPFTAVGKYAHIIIATNLATCIDNHAPLQVHLTQVLPPCREFGKYARYFLYSDPTIIKNTFEHTTQFARHGWITGHIWSTHRAPFPALNVRRRNEPVPTNTIYADTPAIAGVSA